MRQVQEALAGIVAVHADVYKATNRGQEAPAQYVTYVTTTTEDEHWDDEVQSMKTFVYMNLWSKENPTGKAKAIRKAMQKAGFSMAEESTGSSGGEAKYAEGPGMYCVAWTWVYREAVSDGD